MKAEIVTKLVEYALSDWTQAPPGKERARTAQRALIAAACAIADEHAGALSVQELAAVLAAMIAGAARASRVRVVDDNVIDELVEEMRAKQKRTGLPHAVFLVTRADGERELAWGPDPDARPWLNEGDGIEVKR